MEGKKKAENIEALEVLTKGTLTTSSFGPGSRTPYGQPLFSNAHPYGDGANAGTFQNILGGSYGTANKVLSTTSLQDALNIHKASIRLQNGDRIDTPSKYVLAVSRAEAVNARKILNTAGSQVGIFSGTGTNATQLNQFSFNGNMVEILELPYLGMQKADGSYVGTNTTWFLMNTEGLKKAKALKKVQLWDAEVRVFENNNNGNTSIGVDMAFACEHVGAESYIVYSDGSTP
jgi:hypothetical protein